MMVVAGSPTSARYQTPFGQGYDGVVRVSVSGYYGSGALLYDGRAVLTAAHVVAQHQGPIKVIFNDVNGTHEMLSDQVSIYPDYRLNTNANDLAIIWLTDSAPRAADRYELYRSDDEVGQVFSFAGYGAIGSGDRGYQHQQTAYYRLHANNQFDASSDDLHQALTNVRWLVQTDSQLFADFDNGTYANDTFGRLLNRHDLGLGWQEGLIAPGDSGGPAWIQQKIAGVASYISSLDNGRAFPDIDSVVDASFGEVAAWQRVSYYQQWIDQMIRAHYPDAPMTRDQVQTRVVEGDQGTHYAYFLLEFTGVRQSEDQWLSVDFATRDGTAQAGSDYLATQGRLTLYPGETQAVIPVEIIGDQLPEPDEYFYLDVFNPVGGSFGKGVTQLTAMRTIVDDDWLL